MINQAPIVRYRASVSEILFPDFWIGTFSAESIYMPDPNRSGESEQAEDETGNHI